MAFSRVSTGDSVIPSSCELKYEPAFKPLQDACQLRWHQFDPWPGKIPRAKEHLSPTIEPVLYSPCATAAEACALQQEKPLQYEACAPRLESSPCFPQLEKSQSSKEDPAQL